MNYDAKRKDPSKEKGPYQPQDPYLLVDVKKGKDEKDEDKIGKERLVLT